VAPESALPDLASSFVAIFADHPVPAGCRHRIWRRLETEAFLIHSEVLELPVGGPAPLPQLHALAQKTARCRRLMGSLDLCQPLVGSAVTILTAVVRHLEHAVVGCPRRRS
jgi:hypothetical protein